VDATKVGVAGHSLGGVEAFIFAMRNANVSAAIGLDGTYGFSGSSARLLTNAYDYLPTAMRAALLDLRRPDGNEGSTLDLAALHGMNYADRYFITLPKMHHSDFTAFAMVAWIFNLGNSPDFVERFGWTRQTGSTGYQSVCELVRTFLDEELKGDRQALARLLTEASQVTGSTVTHEQPIAAPPSSTDFVDIIGRYGLDSAVKLVKMYQLEALRDDIVNERALNSIGYELLGEHRSADALAVFRLVTFAHPASANAEDSLGDAYLAEGQQSNARAAYQRAVDAAASDPSFDAQGRKSFISTEQSKVQHLTP
jgi:tetratricopeptide (TPR) repeat protein